MIARSRWQRSKNVDTAKSLIMSLLFIIIFTQDNFKTKDVHWVFIRCCVVMMRREMPIIFISIDRWWSAAVFISPTPLLYNVALYFYGREMINYRSRLASPKAGRRHAAQPWCIIIKSTTTNNVSISRQKEIGVTAKTRKIAISCHRNGKFR